VYRSSVSQTYKQTQSKEQVLSETTYCSPFPNFLRLSRSRFSLLLAFVFVLLGCSGGAAGNLLKPASVSSSTAGSSSSTAGSSAGSSSATATSAPASISNTPSADLLSFGNAGYGGDDTNVLQNALNTTAAKGQVLHIPAGNYNVSPISFPSNSKVALDAGVTVTANPGYGPGDKMLNIKSQNVVIAGAGATSVIFKMRKSEYAAEHASDGSEYRHCLNIEGASNVTISGISCNQSGGDGLYIGAASGQGSPSQNVTISDSIFDQNFRQGFSLISGQHIFVYRSYFTNTSGTNPEAGIDIEPNNPSNAAGDVHIEDSFTTGNAGPGVKVALWQVTGASQTVDVTILRHHSSANQQSGYDANNNDVSPNAQGRVLVQDSFSENDGDYGALGRWYQANGPALIFQNLTISNPHQNGPDPTFHDSAAVALMRGGGGENPLGNIQFQGVNIAVTNGKVDRYFNFADGSSKGVEKMVFNPGNLSGASQVPPNGLVQSAGFSTVNQ
jgi:hypothetical protein